MTEPEKINRTGNAMKNVLLTIAYDGTGFCGWQKQPGQRSVQGELERALGIVCAQPIQLNGTSRTDAGVHAYGQRANFTAEFGIPVEKIPVVVNGIFASAASERDRKASGEIAVMAAEEVAADFHARFDAVGKKYVYKISNSGKPDPFQRNYRYQVGRKLDLESMKRAAAHLIGTKDFKCFQAAGGKELESTVRTIYGARLLSAADRGRERFLPSDFGRCLSAAEPEDGLEEDCLEFEIIGDGFLYNMVRIIAGTLVDVGLGKKHADDIPGIIENRDRRLAGHTAPPQGLYLSEVFYENDGLHSAAEVINGKEIRL